MSGSLAVRLVRGFLCIVASTLFVVAILVLAILIVIGSL